MPGSAERWSEPTGPFRADQIREGDHYELSDGHAIHCMTAGDRHGASHSAGAAVLLSDPGVTRSVGIDVGIAFNERKNLRAPDIVVGTDGTQPGWATEAPPLAVEYADVGQSEADLQQKISELLAIGTRIIWVVRLVGPLRVEVYEPKVPVRTVDADGVLTAEGILQNPVPVRALVDREVALEATLHNILGRLGYRDLAHVQEEAAARGEANILEQMRAEIRAQIAERGWTLSPSLADRLAACADPATLMRWLRTSASAGDVEAALR